MSAVGECYRHGPRPIVVSWCALLADEHADRVAADFGYGVPLLEAFAGRDSERARSAWRPELVFSQPLENGQTENS